MKQQPLPLFIYGEDFICELIVSGHTYAPTYIDTHLLITYIYTNTLTPKQTQKEFIHTVTYAHIFDKG